MAAAHFAGTRAGIGAFVVSFVLLDYFYVPPFGSFAIREDTFVALIQYIVPAMMGIWFIEKRRQSELLLERENSLAKRMQGDPATAAVE